MRIVGVVNQTGVGGTEKTACLLLRWASKKGHDVHLVAREGGLRLTWAQTLLGTDRVHIPDSGRADDDALLDMVVGLAPDIAHFHRGVVERPYPHEVRARLPGCKVVEHQIFGDFIADADLTIFVSPEIGARATQAINATTTPYRKFAVLRNPIRMPDGALLHARLDGIDAGTTVVGSIGRPDNAIFDPTHLKALAAYIARHSERRILYVRLGASQFEAEALRALSIPHRLYPATCSDGEITRFLLTLDLYLHSRLDGECDSVSLAEAMAHGVRVLSHAVGHFKGHVEALAAFSEFCECVPAGDEAAYLDGLERMIGDEHRASTAKKVLPRRTKERQGVEVIGNRLLRMYEGLRA